MWSRDGRSLLYIAQDSAGYDHVRSLPADGSSAVPDTVLLHEREIYEVALADEGRTVVIRMGDTGAGEADVAYAALGDSAAVAWRAS